MIEKIRSRRLNPPLGDAVLPRASKRRSSGYSTERVERSNHITSELRIAIEDEVLRCFVVGKRFTHLLRDPEPGGERGDSDMENRSAGVVDHEEDVEHLKRDCGHCEEIRGRKDFSVVAEERRPSLSAVWWRGSFAKIPTDGPLAYIEPEHLQFAVNPGSTPGRILRREKANKTANLEIDPGSARTERTLAAPVPSETVPMPSDDGLGLHDDQSVSPSRPHSPKEYPEESICGSKAWASTLGLEDSDLLTQ